MRRRIFILAGLILLAFQGSVHGQSAAAPDSAISTRTGPIRTLLDNQEQMQLTAAQVARLEAIQSRLEGRNRPLVQRLLQIRRRWDRERPANWAALPAARRRQIQERFQSTARGEVRQLSGRVQRNNRGAMLEVRTVLTEQQRVGLRRFLEEASASADAQVESDLIAPDR